MTDNTVNTVIRKLDHVGIMVPDVQEALDWYSKHLGFSTIDRWSNEDLGMEWAHIEVAGVRVEFISRQNLAAVENSGTGFHHLGIVVDDCPGFVAQLQAGGVTVIMPPSYFDRHDMDWAFVADHLGNVIEIISYRSPS